MVVVDQMFPVLLNGKLAGETSSKIVSESIIVELEKRYISDTVNTPSVSTIQGGRLQMPNLTSTLANETLEVDIKVSKDLILCVTIINHEVINL